MYGMKNKKKMQMGGMMPQTDMSYMPKQPKQVGMMYGGMSVKPKKMMKGGMVSPAYAPLRKPERI